VSHSKIGDVLRAQGNLSAALESYKADLTITERLAKADPGNAGWQRDLALSHGRVAIVLARQGERERALSAFRQGREIIIKLKAADPSNVTLPKDLAWFQGQIRTLEKR
jgi:tetratricopeptide (TPR) repeat protein